MSTRNEEYRFCGYMLKKCNLVRTAGVLPKKISISISNYAMNTKQDVFTITYKFTFFSNQNETSEVFYDAWFELPESDTQLIDIFKKMTRNKDYEMEAETKQKIQSFIQISFPYIRQALSGMTNDAGGMINLPVIDCRNLIGKNYEFLRSDQTKDAKTE